MDDKQRRTLSRLRDERKTFRDREQELKDLAKKHGQLTPAEIEESNTLRKNLIDIGREIDELDPPDA